MFLMFRPAKAKPISRVQLFVINLLILFCLLVGFVQLVNPTLISMYGAVACAVLFMAAVLWLLKRVAVAIVNEGAAVIDARGEASGEDPGTAPRGAALKVPSA
jgi:hypothetical protein